VPSTPQEREHAVQAPQEPAQSTGHASVAHSRRLSVPAWNGQSKPPLATGTVTSNVRASVLLPLPLPPHVTGQADHADHAPTQSTGHACGLHACVSVVAGCCSLVATSAHVAPLSVPCCAYTWKVRACKPPPHVAEHADHAVQEPGQSSVEVVVVVVDVVRHVGRQ
jgi:hypothetical protein